MLGETSFCPIQICTKRNWIWKRRGLHDVVNEHHSGVTNRVSIDRCVRANEEQAFSFGLAFGDSTHWACTICTPCWDWRTSSSHQKTQRYPVMSVQTLATAESGWNCRYCEYNMHKKMRAVPPLKQVFSTKQFAEPKSTTNGKERSDSTLR